MSAREAVVSIYRLRDPLTNDIRYIGQTMFSLDMRLAQHMTLRGAGIEKFAWLQPLKAAGLQPLIELVMRVPAKDADRAEVEQISTHLRQGCPLTNVRCNPNGQRHPGGRCASACGYTRRKVRIVASLHDAIARLALEEDRSISGMIRRLTIEALQARGIDVPDGKPDEEGDASDG